MNRPYNVHIAYLVKHNYSPQRIAGGALLALSTCRRWVLGHCRSGFWTRYDTPVRAGW